MRGFIGIGVFGCDITTLSSNRWRVGFLAIDPEKLPDEVFVKDCDDREAKYRLLLPDVLNQIENNYEVNYERIY